MSNTNGTAVQLALREDIPEISRVLADSWRHAYRGIVADDFLDSLPDDRWEGFLENGFEDGSLLVLKAVDGQGIAGAAILRLSPDVSPGGDLSGLGEGEGVLPPGTGELTALYLLPGYIGTGIGRALYEAAEELLRQHGCTHIVLDVLTGNERAQRFYRRHGFADTGSAVSSELDGREYRCLVMWKKL